MFELRTERFVARGYRPAIMLIQNRGGLTDIHHRLDGEEHPLLQPHAGSGFTKMQDVRRIMEDFAKPMPAIFAYYRIALCFHVALNGVADIARRSAGANHLDAAHHRVVGHLREALGRHFRLAHPIGAAGVAMPAIHNDGHVDVHDVAVVQFLWARDAVAHHMVHAGADGFGKPAIAKWGWHRTGFQNFRVAHIVDFLRAHAGLHEADHIIQNPGCERPRFSHGGKILGTVQFYASAIAHRVIIFIMNIIVHSSITARLRRCLQACRGGPMLPCMSTTVTAALIIIGNEILSGRTHDKNIPHIATKLNEAGVQLREVRVIPDVGETIIATVNALRAAHDYVFTTGGIGPTHDDITAEYIARAFGVKLHRHPEAERLLRSHYSAEMLNEARLKMADVPEGATLIPNPVSTAPGFIIGNVHVMAGVPRIMQAMLDHVLPGIVGGDPVLSVSVTTNLPEGTIADGLTALANAHPAADIGSYPTFKQGELSTTLVIRSTDAALNAQIEAELTALIGSLGGEILPPRIV